MQRPFPTDCFQAGVLVMAGRATGVRGLRWNSWEKDALRVGVASLGDAGVVCTTMETSGDPPAPARRAQQAHRAVSASAVNIHAAVNIRVRASVWMSVLFSWVHAEEWGCWATRPLHVGPSEERPARFARRLPRLPSHQPRGEVRGLPVLACRSPSVCPDVLQPRGCAAMPEESLLRPSSTGAQQVPGELAVRNAGWTL